MNDIFNLYLIFGCFIGLIVASDIDDIKPNRKQFIFLFVLLSPGFLLFYILYGLLKIVEYMDKFYKWLGKKPKEIEEWEKIK